MTAHLSSSMIELAVGSKAKAMHALWQQVKGNRLAPKRNDISLKLVRGLAPWMWRVDVLDGGKDFLFGLAGDRVVQHFGRTFNGIKLSEMTNKAYTKPLWHAYRHCVENKKPFLQTPATSHFSGKDIWEIETLYLPLSENGTDINRLIGTFEYWPLGSHPTATTLG